MKNNPLDKLFKLKSRWIDIYILKEEIADPYEKNIDKDRSLYFKYRIKAIVSNIPSEKLVWKMPGIRIEKAVELIIKKKDLNLIKESHIISIDEEYYAYKENIGQLSLVNFDGDYIKIMTTIRQTKSEND